MRLASSLAARARRFLDVPGLPEAAFLSGLLFIFLPLQVFQANADFFTQFGFVQVLLLLVAIGLCAFAILALAASVGGPRWRRGWAIVLTAIIAAAWGNAMFFTASKGLLDGQAMLRLADAGATRANILWTLAFLAVGAGAGWWVPGMMRRFFAVLFVLLAAHVAWMGAAVGHAWRGAPQTERLGTLSSQRNVLVVLLDAFQSDFFAELVEKDPRLAADFDGFTFFANAVAASPTTYVALPVIHSGVRIGDSASIRQLYDTEVVERSFMAQLARSGFDSMLVNPILGKCPAGATCDNSDQIVLGRAAVTADNAVFLINLALFRALPHLLKPLIYRHGAWWLPLGLGTGQTKTSDDLLDRMAQEVHGGGARPTVRFLHLFNTHAPIVRDAQCGRIEGAPWTREFAMAQDRCALRHLVGLFEALRGRGLYDATAVLVLADHGAGLPREQAGFDVAAFASPLLLFKPRGAKGVLRQERRVVGLADVAATICAETAACEARGGTNIMAGSTESANPAYGFVSYAWTAAHLGADHMTFDNRYEVLGPPREINSWRRLTNLPTAPTTRLDFAKSDAAGTYGFGWSEFEVHDGRTLRWATGSASDVYLNLDAGRDAHLGLMISTHGDNAGQVMGLEVNGAKAAEFPVGFAPSLHEVTLPARLIRNGANRIVFRFLKSNAPGADTRHLAVLFDSLTVSQEKK